MHDFSREVPQLITDKFLLIFILWLKTGKILRRIIKNSREDMLLF